MAQVGYQIWVRQWLRGRCPSVAGPTRVPRGWSSPESRRWRAELVLGDVVAYCGYQGGVEPEPAGAFAFGVGLDQESVAGGVIVRVEFDHGAGDGEDAGGGVEVSGAEFDEFAPAQPGADRDLDQQPRRIVGQGEQKAADFVGGEDAVFLDRHGRRLDAFTGVQADHVVIQSRCEDRGQDDLLMPDRRGRDALVDQVADPFADVDGQDVGHLHRAEPGGDVLVEVVAVGLPSGGFQDVVWEPVLRDVVGEGDSAGGGVAGAAGA